jgi:Spy/CpxP family protein refolding chaperone
MPEPDSSDEQETQQQRAMRTLDAIFKDGKSPAAEAEKLANEFTDRQVQRVKSRFRRRGTGSSNG